MKFQLISDLHLEHARTYQLPVTEGESERVLFLAGDICEFDKKSIQFRFLADVCARFKNVIYVAGNHEYYHGHLPYSMDKFLLRAEKDLPKTFHFLNNKFIEIDDVRIIGTTLWTDFDKSNPVAMGYAEMQISDYKLIKWGNYQKLRAYVTTNEHREALKFLKSAFDGYNGKAIVMTHHAPSSMSIAEEWKGHPLNPAFSSDLSELIADCAPEFWLFGHCHSNFDYRLHETRVICNPRGYPYTNSNEIENPDFNEKLILEI